jgi:hypothetical protein
MVDFLEQALARKRRERAFSVEEMRQILAKEEEPGLLKKIGGGTLGLLGGIGTVLDYGTGARAARYLVGGTDPETGETRSGRAILEKYGILGKNKPGLDFGDVGGFAAEVALDPATYLGGVGALTKGAKAAGAAGKGKVALTGLKTELKAAEAAGDVARRAEVLKKIPSVEKSLRKAEEVSGGIELAKGAGAQARAGQRYLLKGKIPFGPEFPIIRGAPAIEAIEKVGKRLAETAPVRGLRRAFSTKYGRLAETAPLYARHEEALRGGDLGLLERYGTETAGIARGAGELGQPAAKVGAQITRTAEKIGIPDRGIAALKEEIAALRAKTDESVRAARGGALEAFKKRAKELSQGIMDRAMRRAQRIEGRAVVAEQVGGKAQAAALRKQIPLQLLRAEQRAKNLKARAEIPRVVQRVEEAGVAIDFSKPHGVYTSAGHVPSPHADLGGNTFALGTNPAARVLHVDASDLVKSNRGLVGQSAGIAALKAIKGEAAFRGLSALPKRELLARLASMHPDVDWGRYFDAHEMIEALGGVEARKAGYDAIWAVDKQAAEHSEYVGLTGKAFQEVPRNLAAVEKQLYKKGGRQASKRYAKMEPLVREAAALKALPPQIQEPARRLNLEAQGQAALEVGHQAREAKDVLTDPGLAYARRLMTPEARAWAASTKLQTPMAIRMRDFAVKSGSDIRRIPEFQGKTIDQINQIVHAQGGPRKFFFSDPAMIAAFRGRESTRKIATGNLAKSLAAAFPAQAGTTGAVDLAEFLTKAGIAGVDPKALKGMGIPREVAEEFLHVTQKIENPKELEGLARAWQGVNSWFRSLVTAPFPAYHIRNLETNVIMSWLAGVMHPRHYAEAMRLWRDPAARRQFEVMSVLQGGAGREIQGIAGGGSVQAAKKFLSEQVYQGPRKGLGRLASPEGVPVVGSIVRGGFKVGEAVEGISRIAHVLGAKAKGMSDLDAVASVKKYLFDYSDLTDIEKKYLRPFVFFYSWSRHAIPRVLGEYIENPAKMAAMTRGVTQPTTERGPVPSWLRQTAAIPAGEDAGGNKRFLTGLGTPLEELQKLDIFSGGKGILGNAVGKALSLAVPPVKIAAERAFDYDTFLQRKVSEADKAYPWMRFLPKGVQEKISFKEETLPSGHKRLRADPEVLYWLRNSPLSRLMNVFGKLTDPAKSGWEGPIQLGTGVRVTSIDERDELARLLQEKIGGKLEGAQREGKAKRFEHFFATGLKGEKDEEVKRLLKLLDKVRESRKATK